MPDAPIATLRPMECDAYDFDLVRVLPDTLAVVGDLADVVLYTHGSRGVHPDPERRRQCEFLPTLGSPCVWNGSTGFFGLFGFGHVGYKPPQFWTDHAEVECTFLEALRVSYAKCYDLYVEMQPVWLTGALRREHDVLLGHVRGWKRQGGAPAYSAREVEMARVLVLRDLQTAVERFRSLTQRYPNRRLEVDP